MKMLSYGLMVIILCSVAGPVSAVMQAKGKHVITVHFEYGSRPKWGEIKHGERKRFGGKHGGHVLLQIDSEIFSFYPTHGPFHIFPDTADKHGAFVTEKADDWKDDTVGDKYASINIPITDKQYARLKILKDSYMLRSPHDYALFGVRCASAAYDVLEQIKVVPPCTMKQNIWMNFYPKLMRKRLLKMARRQHLKVNGHPGSSTRVWESDFGFP